MDHSGPLCLWEGALAFGWEETGDQEVVSSNPGKGYCMDRFSYLFLEKCKYDSTSNIQHCLSVTEVKQLLIKD